jgi:hypothetical protein
VSAGKHFDRVLIIVLENQNYTSAMKDPFWTQLAQMGASLSNFQALMHPIIWPWLPAARLASKATTKLLSPTTIAIGPSVISWIGRTTLRITHQNSNLFLVAVENTFESIFRS